MTRLKLAVIFLILLCGCSHFSKNSGNKNDTVSLRDSVRDGGYFVIVYFDTMSSDLKVDSADTLMRVATLKSVSKTDVYLSGHADKTGEKKLNMELSRSRAEAVKNYLTGLGVSEADIFAEYYGDDRPAESGNTPEAYAKNRRVEITLKNRAPQ